MVLRVNYSNCLTDLSASVYAVFSVIKLIHLRLRLLTYSTVLAMLWCFNFAFFARTYAKNSQGSITPTPLLAMNVALNLLPELILLFSKYFIFVVSLCTV